MINPDPFTLAQDRTRRMAERHDKPCYLLKCIQARERQYKSIAAGEFVPSDGWHLVWAVWPEGWVYRPGQIVG